MMSRTAKYFLVYVALLVATSSPIWLTQRPQLGDYTNHLARAYILLNVSDSPVLQQFYAPHWDLLPNLAMDLVVMTLTTFMSLEVAGKTFVTLTLLLLSSGTIVLHFALHKRLSAWPLVVFLILYNIMFLNGSLGFLFGLGMGLWMLATWIFLRRHSSWFRTLIFCPLAVALYFAHLSAFGVYLLALLGYEYARYKEQRAEGFQVFPSTWTPALAQLVVPAVLFLLSPTAGGYNLFGYNLLSKAAAPFFLVSNYSLLLDGIVFIFLYPTIFLGLKTKRLILNKAMYWALGAITACYLAIPNLFFSSFLADSRVFVGLALFFVASTDMRLRTVTGTRVLVLALLGTFALRMGFIHYHWQEANHLQDEYSHAFEKLPQGTKLLPLISNRNNWYDRLTMENFSCWAIIKNSALVPTLYAYPTQQPVTFKTPYWKLAIPSTHWAALSRNVPSPDIFNHFNYVLIDRAHPAFALLPQPNLRLVEDGDNFGLFQILRSQNGHR